MVLRQWNVLAFELLKLHEVTRAENNFKVF